MDPFVRQGRRFVAVTDAGKEVLAAIERILAELANLKSIGAEHADESKGHLAVAVQAPGAATDGEGGARVSRVADVSNSLLLLK